MTDNEFSIHIPKKIFGTVSIAVGAIAFLTIAAIVAFQYAKRRTPTIVLPGGITYLGPSPTDASRKSQNVSNANSQIGKIPVPADVSWTMGKGKLFPYTFSFPSSLSLGFFPGDPFDSVTIFWGNTNAQENLLVRVEDLTKIPNAQSYIKKPKQEYVRNWWKNYTWKDVASVTEFKNSKGLKGYRAKYIDASGTSPFDHVFFEVPNRPDLVIWLSGKMLKQEVFDKIVDSVQWTK